MENTILYILLAGVLFVVGFVVYLIFSGKDKLQIERAVRDEISKSIKNQQDTQSKESKSTKDSIDKMHLRLTVIDEAQKNIDELKKYVSNLSGDLGDVKKIFFDNKQARGSFGDKFLEDVIKDNLPSKFYKIQHTLSNGKRVDCLLDFGKKATAVAIDAKFPLPKGLLNNPDENEKKKLESEFNTVITKHYSDIAEKYIIDGETMNLALMFIPSHQVFNYINEHSKNWIDKARLKGVQIVSPTTLWIALKSYRLFAEGYIMNENSSKILTEMKLIIEDVSRLSKRIGTIEKKHVFLYKLLLIK